MANFGRNAPPIAAALASLVLWASFAWGLPADAPAAEGEADVAAEVVPSEPTPEPRKITGWFYAGVGIGNGFAGNVALNLKYGRYQGILGATHTAGLFSSSGSDIGLLFGYCPSRYLGIAGGISWVRAVEYYQSHYLGVPGVEVRSNTVGIPVEFQVYPRISRYVSVELAGHVNFNDKFTFVGLTAGIQLGKLK